MTETARLSRSYAIWLIAVGQLVGYASLYYSFAALIGVWRAEFDFPPGVLAAGLMVSTLLAAATAPFTGALVDRGRAMGLMVCGPLVGVVSLGLLATSQTPWGYLLAWSVNGFAQSMFLYDVGFAFLVRRLGPDARSAIVRVTLVAGFASTLAFPAAALLSDGLGWRGTLWSAAAGLALISPLNFLAVRHLRQGDVIIADLNRHQKHAARLAVRRPVFWIVALVFALIALNHWMLITYFLPIVTGLGAAEKMAVIAASLVGPGQVAGRFLLMKTEQRLSNRAATVGVVSAMLLSSVLLSLAGAAPVLIFGFAVIQGAAGGIVTILKPVLISEILGREGFGTISGLVQLPATIATALGPMLAAGLLAAAGVGAILLTSLVLVSIALSIVVFSGLGSRT